MKKQKNILLITLLLVFFVFASDECSNTTHKGEYIGDTECTCWSCGKTFKFKDAIFIKCIFEEKMGIDFDYHEVKCPYCGSIGRYTPATKLQREFSKLYWEKVLEPTVDEVFKSCFIATAAYGTPFSQEVEILRQFRDQYLISNPIGKFFVNFYYKISPPIASFIAKSNTRRAFVRILLFPVIKIAKLLVKEK